MADISAIKLPNNTTLTLKDATALEGIEFANHQLVATKRSGDTETVDIGTFDTLSATDLNAGNLLVTGGARFTNDIYGVTHDDLEPIATATYTGLLGTSSNNAANDSFYFMKVRPDDFYCHWVLRYRITATIPNQTNYSATSDVTFYGYGQTSAPGQHIFNNIYSTSYRPYYFHNFYRLTSAGYNAGYSNAIGIGLRSSTSRNTTGYERTIKVEVLETVNCAVELLDTPVKWASWSGTGTTNYTGLTEYNGCDNGLQEAGDSNTIDRRQLSSSQRLTAGANGIKANSLIMKDSTDKWQSLTTTTGIVTHTKNPSGFYPYNILYYASSAVGANSLTANGNYIYETIPFDLRYSTNCGQTLTSMKSVYLVGTIQNGLFYLDDLWYTQTLPSTNDGKVYIYIGEAYNTYCINLSATHPIYYFDGYLKQYSGDAPYTFAGTTGGFTVTPKGSTTSQTVDISGFLPTTGGVVNGPITATDLSVGNIVATGTGRFASGVIGDVTGNVTGNADTAAKVYVTTTTPTSTTNYYLTYTDAKTSGNQDLRNSGRLYLYDTGTTVYFNIGNTTNSGAITLHNANEKYANIVTSAFTANRTITLPDATGTIALTSQLSSYLPLSGGTMTGKVTFVGNQSSAWNDKGIVFTNGSRIGESGVLGIYSVGNVIIRPNSGSSAADAYGITISTTEITPAGNSTINLGSSSAKWKNIYATDVTATNVSASGYITVNSSNSGTAGGLALYSTIPTDYGIAMRNTSNLGVHGYVNVDWATYFNMTGTSAANSLTRGWIFRNKFIPENVASISGSGNMVINGSLTVGGNAANTSGCRMEFDSTLNCVDFIFN